MPEDAEVRQQLLEAITKLNDRQDSPALPNVPVIGPLRPWINLVHVIGLPWFIIVVSVYYGVPYGKQALEQQLTLISEVKDNKETVTSKLDDLDKKAKVTNAILTQIQKVTIDSASQRHDDINELRVGIGRIPKTTPSKAEEEECPQ